MTDEQIKQEIGDAKLSEALSTEDAQLVFAALGIYSSDYNDAPHDRIEDLRNRLERIGARR